MVTIHDDQLYDIKTTLPNNLRAFFDKMDDIEIKPADGFKRVLIKLDDEDIDAFRQTKNSLFTILIQCNAYSKFNHIALDHFGATTIFQNVGQCIEELDNL